MKDPKVPNRLINRNQNQPSSKCFCSQLCKLINQENTVNNVKSPLMTSINKRKCTGNQTDPTKNNIETQSIEDMKIENLPDEKSLAQIQIMLKTINNTLESILTTLEGKKERLYMQGLMENYQFGKVMCEHRRSKRSRHSRSKHKDTEIANDVKCKMCLPRDSMSILCLPKQFMEQSLGVNYPILLPKMYSFLYNYKPLSCPDINYFQTLGKIIDPKRSLQNVSVNAEPTCDIQKGEADISTDFEDAIP